jgi:hypothetical protein
MENTTTVQRGMRCEILQHKSPAYGNCSNNGISKTCEVVTVLREDGKGPFNVREDAPAVRIVRRTIMGKPYVHAEPVDKPEGRVVGPMSGGCYIVGDSTFQEYVGSPYPVPLHDRFETAAQYRELSR